MKKRTVSLFLIASTFLLGITTGFFIGRNVHHEPVRVMVPCQPASEPEITAVPVQSVPSGSVPESSPEETFSASEPTESCSEFPVNINTASLTELDTIPGIGPVLAQRIYDYRTEHGPFESPDDLLDIKGIGVKTLDKLRDYIVTGG